MSSAKKKAAATSSVLPVTATTVKSLSPIKLRTDKEGFVQLSLHVKPGAKVSRVAEITESYIGLQVISVDYMIKFYSCLFVCFRFPLLLEMVKLTRKL